ncbi:MAG: putative acyltransferase [Acidimicrobiales bacterium]|nr:putative acyltransferase [Acidimicrobiales bacterium]
MRHIGALDGLRGVAVAAVLVFHGGHLRGGYLGVDLFFVLSGYLITLLLLAEWRRNRRIRLAEFWARRARRLFPALLVMLVGIAAYAHFVAIPEELGSIRADSFATLFYVANWHAILAGHTYFQAGLAPSPLEHTWSLAIEEQFYVIWPLAVVALLRWRSKPSTILRAAVAVAVVSVALMVGLHLTGAASPNSLYLGTHTRIAAIAMGAALAAWQVGHGHTKDRTSRLALEAAAVASVAFLAFMWAGTDLTTTVIYTFGLAWCGVAVTTIIAAATHPERMVVSKALTFAPLRWLGLISYGVYLYHWPIYLYLTEHRTGLSGWTLLLVQASAAIAIGTISYVLLERPIRYGALKGVTAKVAMPAAAVVTAIALIAATSGAISAITQSRDAAAAVASGQTGTPRLMVAGDSVAYVLGVEGIAPIRNELGVTLVNVGSIGCTPMVGFGPPLRTLNSGPDFLRKDCTKNFSTFADQYRPDVVMLLYGTLFSYNIVLDGTQRDQCDPRYEELSRGQLKRQVADLSKHGATVVLVTSPGVQDPATLVRFGIPDDMRRAACSNDVIRQVARADRRTRLVDLDAFVCPKGRCIEEHGGQKLRSDSVHYRYDMAKYVSRWLVPRVLVAARQHP